MPEQSICSGLPNPDSVGGEPAVRAGLADLAGLMAALAALGGIVGMRGQRGGEGEGENEGEGFHDTMSFDERRDEIPRRSMR